MKTYKQIIKEEEKSKAFPAKLCKSCTNFSGKTKHGEFCDQSHWGLSKDGKTCDDYDKGWN